MFLSRECGRLRKRETVTQRRKGVIDRRKIDGRIGSGTTKGETTDARWRYESLRSIEEP